MNRKMNEKFIKGKCNFNEILAKNIPFYRHFH